MADSPDRLVHALKYSQKLVVRRERRRVREDRAGFIYIMECHEYVKVGIADDPPARLVQLQVGCPYELRLLATFKTRHAATDEARLHVLWKAWEVRGEWFRVPAGELASVINAPDFKAVFL